jgi:hypothetical protein
VLRSQIEKCRQGGKGECRQTGNDRMSDFAHDSESITGRSRSFMVAARALQLLAFHLAVWSFFVIHSIVSWKGDTIGFLDRHKPFLI